MSYHLQKHIMSKKEISLVDHLMGIAAIIHPLTAAPQVYSIYTTQDVSGVSLSTWVGFMVLGMVFLAYGLTHKIKPYIATQVLWLINDVLIVTGIIMFS